MEHSSGNRDWGGGSSCIYVLSQLDGIFSALNSGGVLSGILQSVLEEEASPKAGDSI